MNKVQVLTIAVLLLLGVAACGAPATSPAVPPSQATNTPGQPSGASAAVTISGFAFNPASLTVKVGTTVTWTNKDSTSHTVASDAGDWTSPSLGQGQSFSYTFNQAGTFAYHCSIHPNMKATITVTQ